MFERLFDMKKILSIALACMILLTIFVGCAKDDKPQDKVVSDTSSSEAVTKNEINTLPSAKQTETIPVEDAVLSSNDAANFIAGAYTAKELGLKDVQGNYTFMTANSAVKIDGKKYIFVDAGMFVESDNTDDKGNKLKKRVTVGEYYIAYDNANKVLMKDLSSEKTKYKELPARYDEYKKAQKEAAEKATKAETSKKK